jgi:predicted NBD/HSP70 family sugar kinase
MENRSPNPTSPATVLDLLRRGGPLTRAELLERTGMARSTLVEKVELLRRHQLIRDAEVRRGTGGRPAVALAFDGASRHLLLVDLGATHGTFAIADLSLRLLAVHRERLDTLAGPGPVLPLVVTAARTLLAGATSSGVAARPLLGVGVGFPGQVAPDRATLADQTMMRGWSGVELAQLLQADFGVPVLVDNDANAMAFGEHVAAVARGAPRNESLLVVKVSTGIGAGLIVDGALHRGASGGAGEIGHVRLNGERARCTCGARGCLGAAASGRALLAALRSRGARQLTDVVRLVSNGDSAALSAIVEAGAKVGTVLAGVATMVDPDAVLLGGEIGRLPAFVAAVRQPLFELVPMRTARRLRLDRTTLADDSAITGLAGLVLDACLAPPSLETLLTAPALAPPPEA